MPVMLNSLIPKPGTEDEYFNIPGWGERFVQSYIGQCPLGFYAVEGEDYDDIRVLQNLDIPTMSHKEYEVVEPKKVFCLPKKNLLKTTLHQLTNVS